MELNLVATNPKDSMAAIFQCISTGNDANALDLARGLFDRHGPFKTWAGLWWSTIISAVQQSNSENSKAVIGTALANIELVDEKSTGMLDALISAWLDSLPIAAAIECMSQKTSLTFTTVLLHLCARRRLRSMSKVMDKLVYPAWKGLTMTISLPTSRLSAKQMFSLESTLSMAQQILLITPPNKSLPPFTLRESMVIQTECCKVLSSTNVPTLIQHLPFLVLLQSVRTTPVKHKKQISTLIDGLAISPEFKAAAFRHMEVLKSAFLSNEWSKSGLDPSIEAGMIDALKLIMSQESPGTQFTPLR
jgi:mediator of RNA polymerase II transcription subunit 12